MQDSTPKTQSGRSDRWSRFPWWFVAAVALLIVLLVFILADTEFNAAFRFIVGGLPETLLITLVSAALALPIGALVGYASRSKHAFWHGLATFYLAIIGGIPTIVMIFIVALVVVPQLASWVASDARLISISFRGILALGLVYGAIFGDVFRLGTSADSQGMQVGMGFRPGRNTLVALGLAFMALLRDSSLFAVLAVQEITQMARLHGGTTFHFTEGYLVAAFFYLILTLPLRLVVQLYEQRSAERSAQIEAVG